MATYTTSSIGSSSRRESFLQLPRFQTAGVGSSLGGYVVSRRYPESFGSSIRPTPQGVELPKSGRIIARQEYASDLPIVFSEISGREQLSIFVPQKGAVLSRKGASTQGATKVRYVDLSKPNAAPTVRYVKTSTFAHKYIKDIGENHAPEKRMNYSFTNSVWGLASDAPDVVSIIETVADRSLFCPVGMSGFKLASVGGLLTGFVNWLRAGSEWESASRINDVAGKQFARMRYWRSLSELSGGVITAVKRVDTLIHGIAKIDTVERRWIGALGTLITVGNITLLCTSLLMKARKSQGFINDLDKSMKGHPTKEAKTAAGLRFLIGALELSGKEKQELSNELISSPLYTLVSEQVFLNRDEEEILHKRDREEIAQTIEEMLSAINKRDYPLISDWDQVRQNLSVRLMKGWAHHKMVREAEYGRMVGGGSLALLQKKIRGEKSFLSDKLYYNETALRQANDLIRVARGEVSESLGWTAFTVIGCALSLIAMSGVMPLTPIIGIVANIMAIYGDFHWFQLEMGGLKDSSYKERYVIRAFMVLTVLSGAIGGVIAKDILTKIVVATSSMGMLYVEYKAHALSEAQEKEAQNKRRQQELLDHRENERQIVRASTLIHPAF